MWKFTVRVCVPKKTAIKKNSTVSDRESNSLSDTVDFFSG
jgi:hypothetical protein